jgi:hypothetical protein
MNVIGGMDVILMKLIAMIGMLVPGIHVTTRKVVKLLMLTVVTIMNVPLTLVILYMDANMNK